MSPVRTTPEAPPSPLDIYFFHRFLAKYFAIRARLIARPTFDPPQMSAPCLPFLETWESNEPNQLACHPERAKRVEGPAVALCDASTTAPGSLCLPFLETWECNEPIPAVFIRPAKSLSSRPQRSSPQSSVIQRTRASGAPQSGVSGAKDLLAGGERESRRC